MSGYRLEGFVEGLERERRKVRERLGEGEIVFDVTERDGRVRLVAQEEAAGWRMKRGAWRSCSALAAAVAAAHAVVRRPEPTRSRRPRPSTGSTSCRAIRSTTRSSSRSTASRRPRTTRTCATTSATCWPLRRFPKEAAEQYENALNLDKKNFISAYNLGLVRETEGKISEAISAYQRSIKRKPGFPQSRFRLGRLYEHANQLDDAVKEYAAAMWIDPGDARSEAQSARRSTPS